MRRSRTAVKRLVRKCHGWRQLASILSIYAVTRAVLSERLGEASDRTCLSSIWSVLDLTGYGPTQILKITEQSSTN